jgi:hypothetical protein
MRKVYSVHDIWVQFERHQTAKIPSILSIKLTNQVSMTEGRLVLFDLLHPAFSPFQSPNSDNKARNSFVNLCMLSP